MDQKPSAAAASRFRVRNVRSLLAGYVAIALLAGWPILSAVAAGLIASWNDCTLHEGFRTPCVVLGRDVGGMLYQMGVMGWAMLVTIPLGAMAALVWTAVWVVLRRASSR